MLLLDQLRLVAVAAGAAPAGIELGIVLRFRGVVVRGRRAAPILLLLPLIIIIIGACIQGPQLLYGHLAVGSERVQLLPRIVAALGPVQALLLHQTRLVVHDGLCRRELLVLVLVLVLPSIAAAAVLIFEGLQPGIQGPELVDVHLPLLVQLLQLLLATAGIQLVHLFLLKQQEFVFLGADEIFVAV